ncbi:hypothetical protein AXG93_146s1030 [Marchantia polymorpha subsp. ruderalis]|uniref:Uncharacterized protein n=1 Tax=Marchantia polymorpha subsp. ruderalis TaxID=1480154 RepID=A0A176W7R4_MARPO|nr:hypothetical protein AXG93_146s1030 [Marchantia polymorpha subsp. ruderalis]
MPFGEKVGDSEVPKIQTVEVVNGEERDQEQELTRQPQVEENQVNTAAVGEKNFGLDWDEELAIEKLLEESGIEYRICEDELLDLPKDITDHLRDVQERQVERASGDRLVDGSSALSPLVTTPIAWEYSSHGVCVLDLFGGIIIALTAVLQLVHQLLEPNADERQRAMGFMTSVTATSSVSNSSRRQVVSTPLVSSLSTETVVAMVGGDKRDIRRPWSSWDVTRVLARVAAHALGEVLHAEVAPKEGTEILSLEDVA